MGKGTKLSVLESAPDQSPLAPDADSCRKGLDLSDMGALGLKGPDLLPPAHISVPETDEAKYLFSFIIKKKCC